MMIHSKRLTDFCSATSSLEGEADTAGANARTSTFRPDDHSAAVEAAAPSLLGRYEIGRRLGRGAYGAVYLAWDPQLKREVAVKVPRLVAENLNAQIDMFVAEAQRAVQLERHPGIVPVYDVGSDGERVYIVSQYLEGGSLAARLAGGRLPVHEVVDLVAELADVVEFAHSRGWVHRDIKPANILLNEAGRPFLADFGLTTPLEELQRTGSTPQGTPNYMSPEAFRALREGESADRPDQRSDVYSLGVVLYEALAGRLPFEAANLDELMTKVLTSEPLPLSQARGGLPKKLTEVCHKAIARDPRARYSTAGEFKDDLRAVAAILPKTTAERPDDDESNTLLTPLNLGMAVVGAALLAVLAIIAAVVVFSTGGNSTHGETWQVAAQSPSDEDAAQERQLRLEYAARDLRRELKQENEPDKRPQSLRLSPPPLRGGGEEAGGTDTAAEPPAPADFKEDLPDAVAAESEALFMKGKAADERGDPEAALEAMNAALRIAERRDDRNSRLAIHCELAAIHSRSGNERAAADACARAWPLADGETPYAVKSQLLTEWVLSLAALGDTAQARRRLADLQAIARDDDETAQRILKELGPLLNER